MTEPAVVEREEIAVQFVAVEDGLEHIRRAWDDLEAAVALHRRRFWGAFYPESNEYRACVEVRSGDAPVPGLEAGTLPGGRFLRARLHGEPPGVYERIGPTFDELLAASEHDRSRPSLEYYRRRDDIDLLLPVLHRGT